MTDLFSGPVVLTVSPDGSRAYVVGRPSTFHVVDLADPRRPSIMGSVEVPLLPRALAGDAGLAVVLDQSYEIQAIDVSDPQTPSILGSAPLGFSGSKVTLRGATAYVAADTAGLVLVDLSVPSEPRVAGRADTEWATDVEVVGQYAYVADAYSGLYVVDVSDLDAPAIVANLPLGHASRVTAEGSRAYVVVSTGSGQYLQVADIADPANPALLGTVGGSQIQYSDLAVIGGVVYLMEAGGLGTLRSVDPTDPQNPVWLGLMAINGSMFPLDSEFAYVLGQAPLSHPAGVPTLFVLDVSNPANPPPSPFLNLDCSRDVAVDGAYAYVTSNCSAGLGRLYVLDLTAGGGPAVVGSVSLPISPTPYDARVTLDGSLAYVAGGDLTIVDVADPNFPALVGNVVTPGFATDVAAAGSLVCVADDRSGFQVVDASMPTSPVIVGHYATAYRCFSVALSGNLAYVGNADDNTTDAFLHAIDVSDPFHPAVAGSIGIGVSAKSVILAGNLAYVAAGPSGLAVVDVSNPAAMAVIGRAPSVDYSYDVALDGVFAYVNQGYAPTEVFNVSDPSAPVRIGRLDSGHLERAIAVGGGRVLTVEQSRVRFGPPQCEPPTPVFLTDLKAEAVATGILLSWRVPDRRFLRFTVARTRTGYPDAAPGGSKEFSIVPAGETVRYLDQEVVPAREYTYTVTGLLANGTRTILGSVRGVLPAALPMTLAISPNPARESAAITLNLAERGWIELAIHDVAGRGVRSVLRGPAGPGSVLVRWDGKDDAGRPAAAGMYYARLSGRGGERIARFVLVR